MDNSSEEEFCGDKTAESTHMSPVLREIAIWEKKHNQSAESDCTVYEWSWHLNGSMLSLHVLYLLDKSHLPLFAVSATTFILSSLQDRSLPYII